MSYVVMTGLSGYSTDLDEGAAITGASPLPLVSPSLGLGPQMHPRLAPTSHTSSALYTAHTYKPPPTQAALSNQHIPSHQARSRDIHSAQVLVPKTQLVQHGLGRQHDIEGLPQREAAFRPDFSGQAERPMTTNAEAHTSEHSQTWQDTEDEQLHCAADPMPALQTNLTAMEAAISETATAALLTSQGQLPAASSSAAAFTSYAPKQAALPPLTALTVPKLTQPASAESAQSQQAVSAPSGILTPVVSQQAVMMPAGNVAAIGPPAVRTMTSHGPGALPQLAAPALLPKVPVTSPPLFPSAGVAAFRPLPTAADTASKPATGNMNTSAAPDTRFSTRDAAVSAAGGTAADADSGTSSRERAGAQASDEVKVSAGSAVTANEGRAAGTAHQPALPLLDEPLLPRQEALLQARALDSVSDQPFSTTQSSWVSTSNRAAQLAALPGVRPVSLAAVDKTAGLLSTVSSMGEPQSKYMMTGPLPTTGQGQEVESPLAGRPSQSETAITSGRGLMTVTEPQDLHAAHLVHVLQAHKATQQLTDSAALSSELQPRRVMAAESRAAVFEATDSGSLQQQSGHAGKHAVSTSMLQLHTSDTHQLSLLNCC